MFRSGSDFCTVNSTPRALTSKFVVEALDGDIGELHAVDGADIDDHHVDLAAIGCDLGVESVEVLELPDAALHAGDVPADRGDRLGLNPDHAATARYSATRLQGLTLRTNR